MKEVSDNCVSEDRAFYPYFGCARLRQRLKGALERTAPTCRPDWIGNAGFEWVYRFLREPQKLWLRDLLDGPRFLFHAGMELLRNENPVANPSNGRG